MPRPPLTQLIAYGLIAVAVLAVGYRALGSAPAGPGTAERAAGPEGRRGGGGGDGEFSLGDGSGGRLVVDVAGAVRRPGVYTLPQGSRVLDAIRRAGGATRRALPGGINRAALVVDGQQVVVPGAASGPGGAAAATPAGGDAPISLGTATAEQLEEIDGIGPVTAEKIVEFRDSHGGVASVDQLDQISGIGPVTMESLRAGLQP